MAFRSLWMTWLDQHSWKELNSNWLLTDPPCGRYCLLKLSNHEFMYLIIKQFFQCYVKIHNPISSFLNKYFLPNSWLNILLICFNINNTVKFIPKMSCYCWFICINVGNCSFTLTTKVGNTVLVWQRQKGASG